MEVTLEERSAHKIMRAPICHAAVVASLLGKASLGGAVNTADGLNAAVVGGDDNTAAGDASFIGSSDLLGRSKPLCVSTFYEPQPA